MLRILLEKRYFVLWLSRKWYIKALHRVSTRALENWMVLAHWEDESGLRTGHADHNLAILRHLTLNLLTPTRRPPKLGSKPNVSKREGAVTIS